MIPWKRGVLSAGLGAFGLAASAGCTCYATVSPEQLRWEQAGASSRVSGLAAQLGWLEKAVSASRVTPEVARTTLDNIRRDIDSLAEEGRQGRLTDFDKGAVTEFTERANALAVQITKASEAKP